jgi:hypothetical protein
MRNNTKTNMKGFTVIELLLYMGIASILLFVLFDMFTMILSTHAESQSTSAIDQDAAFILNRLSYDIHKASSITAPTLGTTCTWPTVSSCQLVLNNATYSVTSGTLNLTQSSETKALNSVNTQITNISFETRGNSAAGSKPSVQIQFTLQSTVKTNTTKSFQTTITTR